MRFADFEKHVGYLATLGSFCCSLYRKNKQAAKIYTVAAAERL